MSFYVAGRLSNLETVQRLIKRLGELGAWGHCLYDWTVHGSIQGEGEAAYAALATKELDAVTAATAVFVLLPGGRGTHVELGAALASQKLAIEKQIFVLYEKESDLVETYTSIFYYHPGVTRHLLSVFLPGCKRCGKEPAYAGAIYCGAAECNWTPLDDSDGAS